MCSRCYLTFSFSNFLKFQLHESIKYQSNRYWKYNIKPKLYEISKMFNEIWINPLQHHPDRDIIISASDPFCLIFRSLQPLLSSTAASLLSLAVMQHNLCVLSNTLKETKPRCHLHLLLDADEVCVCVGVCDLTMSELLLNMERIFHPRKQNTSSQQRFLSKASPVKTNIWLALSVLVAVTEGDFLSTE